MTSWKIAVGSWMIFMWSVYSFPRGQKYFDVFMNVGGWAWTFVAFWLLIHGVLS